MKSMLLSALVIFALSTTGCATQQGVGCPGGCGTAPLPTMASGSGCNSCGQQTASDCTVLTGDCGCGERPKLQTACGSGLIRSLSDNRGMALRVNQRGSACNQNRGSGLFSRIKNAGGAAGCSDCGSANVTPCAAEAPASDCGCASLAPASDCGCGEAPAVDAGCGCETPSRGGLLGSLRAKAKGKGCGCAAAAPAADCGCADPAPAADCGCEAAPAAAADCGCEAAAPAADCGCATKKRGPIRMLFSDKGSCDVAPAAADCGCEEVAADDCGCEEPVVEAACEAAPADNGVGGLLGKLGAKDCCLFGGRKGARGGIAAGAGMGCGTPGCGIGGQMCGGCLSKLRGAGQNPYGGIPHTAQGPGNGTGMAPAYAYPYYTTRGPRDFLMKNPPSIGY